MMLLGVLTGYSWGSFLTYLICFDIVVIVICFALDRLVWSRDQGQTKNDRRSKREDDDGEDVVDYRKLDESVVDYNEVKVVDEEPDDEYTDYSVPNGSVEPVTSDLSDGLGYGEEPRMTSDDDDEVDNENLVVFGKEDPAVEGTSEGDDTANEEEVASGDDIEMNNNLAHVRYLNDDPSCRIISSDDFDEEARGNIEYLPDEEDDEKEDSEDDDLTDVYIQQGDGEPVPLEDDDEEFGEADVDVLNSAYPKNIDDVLEEAPEPDDMDDPKDEPDFND